MNPINDQKSTTRSIIVGTRGSALAQWQTDFVINALKSLAPNLQVERRVIKTSGDKDQTRPLAEFGGLGVFTKEIENALLAHEIDLAVHSLKDLPTETTAGLTIAAITDREDARDCLVSRHNLGLMQLPQGARVGTSSARRAAQILSLRSDLQIVPLRGNVDTRLRKAQSEDYDAIVIAAAGLIRLGRKSEIAEYLPLEMVLPDPGQGALAVETRADDGALLALLSGLDHAPSGAATRAERAFLRALGGGCHLPIGAYATVGANASLSLLGMIASLDGTQVVRGEMNGDGAHTDELGIRLADQLLSQGGAKILGMQVSASKLGQVGQLDWPPKYETENHRQLAPNAFPLRGRMILITRAQEQAGVLADKIRALGGEPLQFPVIEFAPLEDFRELDAALERAGEFDWIVFTSANGVRAVAERLGALASNPGLLAGAKLAAIGPATAGALEKFGLRVDFIPSKFLGEQIAVELPVKAGQQALLLRANIASDTLARGLAARGVNVTEADAYRTIMPPSRIPDLSRIDAVTFTSSSTVRNFIAMLDAKGTDTPNGFAIFCIGPVTAETARELGLHIAAVAKEHTIDGLVRVMLEFYRQGDVSIQ